MRTIDIVNVKGSPDPLRLYTVDVEYNHLELEPAKPKHSMKESKIQRVRARMRRDDLRQICFNQEFNVYELYETDRDLIEMREMFTPVSSDILTLVGVL